jgi:hypothetical protein
MFMNHHCKSGDSSEERNCKEFSQKEIMLMRIACNIQYVVTANIFKIFFHDGVVIELFRISKYNLYIRVLMKRK